MHPWTLLLKNLCISQNYKATSDKVSNGSDQKCSKELKNNFSRDHGLKLQYKMCENQHFPCFVPQINNHLSWGNYSAVIRFLRMLPIRNIYDLSAVTNVL